MSAPRKHNLTSEELTELETRYKSGETYTSLAREQGITDTALRCAVNRNRLKRNKQPQTIFLNLRKPVRICKRTGGKKWKKV